MLLPHDLNSYYKSRELVPNDMLDDLRSRKIVITNYHAFKLRERLELSKGWTGFAPGRGEELSTLETEGQMIQRVMPALMGMKNIIVLNDEGHHCYRYRADAEEEDLPSNEEQEAERNNETARLWIWAGERSTARSGVTQVFDLSATPSFSERLGLRQRHPFPLDHERFFADGCHRVRDRQAAVQAYPWPTTSLAGRCLSFAIFGSIFGPHAQKGRGKAKTLDPP